ncbi:MAG: hypothetical protein FWH10_07245 [Oscillospiraceae bacterium]|nr:hypothetical protein [Oscillospiraceae bacterium]
MLGCNQNITIWQRKKTPGTGCEFFVRKILPVKCRWRNRTERDINNLTSNIYTSCIAIIPYYPGLSGLELKEGDIMALGVCDIDITGNSPYTIGDVKRLYSPNIAVIKSIAYNFSDNNSGDFEMKGKHLRLTGD